MFFSHSSSLGFFAYFWALSGAILTILYSLRLLYLVFFTKIKSYKYSVQNFHPNTFFILFSLIVLALSAIWFGKIFQQPFLYFFSSNHVSTFNLSVPLFIKILPFILFLVLFILYFYYSNNFFKISPLFYNFLSHKWYIDILSNRLITHKFYHIAFNFFYLKIEKGWIEFFGPTGVIQIFTNYGKYLFLLQQNRFHSFLTFIVVLFILIFLV
jgi:NADH-ubiquinone oxidoreductase chain 5